MTILTPTPGNETGLHSTTRRNLLCAAPAALMAGATLASNAEQEAAPIMVLFREWQAQYDLMSADNEDASDDKPYTYTTGTLTKIERQMLALPSQDARDLAAKILAVTHLGDFCIDMRGAYPIMDELCDLTGAA